MKTRWSRREFLKTTTAAVVLGAAEKTLGAAASSLPRRRLGKTGEMVSCIGFGSGTRFCSIEDENAAQALLERAFAFGINYFDTAGSYTRRGIERLSEKRLGEFIKNAPQRNLSRHQDRSQGPRRRAALCRDKSQVPANRLPRSDSDSQLERSRTTSSASARPNGVLAAIQQLKEQKVVRFIGITGHNDGAAMTEALRRHDFDTVLMALNAAQSANPVAQRKMEPIPAFENSALPVALQKNMGILSMKVMGQGMLVGAGAGRASRGGAVTIQPQPARRQRHHRLRTTCAARTKRPSRAELHADQRKRQATIARKSRAVALGVAEFFADA